MLPRQSKLRQQLLQQRAARRAVPAVPIAGGSSAPAPSSGFTMRAMAGLYGNRLTDAAMTRRGSGAVDLEDDLRASSAERVQSRLRDHPLLANPHTSARDAR
jgi:hypothetical protein